MGIAMLGFTVLTVLLQLRRLSNEISLVPRRNLVQVTEDREGRTIGLIHLGKSGGTVLLETIGSSTPNIMMDRKIEYFHLRKPIVEKYRDWIVLVRDPIERMKSNYIFEHTKNAPYRVAAPPQNGTIEAMRQKRMLFECYETLDEAFTIGLATPSEELNDCPMLIKKFVTGKFGLPTNQFPHSYYNFEFYFRDLLTIADREEKRIYVIRSEHMLDDLNQVHRLISGTDRTAFQAILPDKHYSSKKRELPVHDRTISSIGLHNVCRELCEEIQIYKQVFRRAYNFPEFRRLSSSAMVPDLHEKCPDEVNLLSVINGKDIKWKCSKLRNGDRVH